MNKNIQVIGSYKCGCSYGPIRVGDRLEYCGTHGGGVANEYSVPAVNNSQNACPNCGADTMLTKSFENSVPHCDACGTPL